jgi:hypothetical protein
MNARRFILLKRTAPAGTALLHACAASDHAAATPPNRLRNSRRHNRDRIHLALERVLMIRIARQAPADVRFALLRGRREDILRSRVRANFVVKVADEDGEDRQSEF